MAGQCCHRRVDAPTERHSLLGNSIKVPKASPVDAIVNLICIIVFVTASSGPFFVLPLTQLVEDVVCQQYYDELQRSDEPFGEVECKLNPIQSKMALIFATMDMIRAICGFVSVFPWSVAADRIGRKPVYITAIFGIAATMIWSMMVLFCSNIFPIWVLFLSGGFYLIGGGDALLIIVILSSLTDVVPEDRRVVMFLRAHIAGSMGYLLSPALASTLMRFVGPWPTICVAPSLLVCGGLGFILLPETRQLKEENNPSTQIQSTTLVGYTIRMYQRLAKTLSIFDSPYIVLVLLTHLSSNPIFIAIASFLIQFASKRYNIRISDTGYLQGIFGVAQTIVSLILLPYMSTLMINASTPWPLKMRNERQRDLVLARWSYLFLILGFLVLGVAPNIVFFVMGLIVSSLGVGFNSLTRSLLSFYVKPESRSQAFSMMSMIEVLGSTFGPPMLAALFTTGLSWGGSWIGLPYYGMASLCLLMLIMMIYVRVPKAQGITPMSYDEADHQN